MGPKIMFVRVSENCNAGCFMCNFAHSHGLYNITAEQYDWLLDAIKEKGTYEMIRFSGGEPLLHPNIIDMIKKSKEQGYETSIITNGYLLSAMAEKIANSGIDQIIISIDGSVPEIHDNLRGLPNGLEKIKNGVRKIKEINPNIVFRANTVVSELNIKDLCNMYAMLNDLSFNSWAIIPIRPTNDPNTKWNEENIEMNKLIYKKFLQEQKQYSNIELLGYSANWAGKTEEEINKTFKNQYRVMPKKQCELVDLVRFYIPDKNLIVPCNCAAHRIHQIETEYQKESEIFAKANIMAEWLKYNAYNHCSGCEPLNAYLADNPKILKKGLYKY